MEPTHPPAFSNVTHTLSPSDFDTRSLSAVPGSQYSIPERYFTFVVTSIAILNLLLPFLIVSVFPDTCPPILQQPTFSTGYHVPAEVMLLLAQGDVHGSPYGSRLSIPR